MKDGIYAGALGAALLAKRNSDHFDQSKIPCSAGDFFFSIAYFISTPHSLSMIFANDSTTVSTMCVQCSFLSGSLNP